MSVQLHRRRFFNQGIGVVAVVIGALSLAALGQPPAAADPKPDKDKKAEASDLAAQRGLQEKPIAAGRNKDILVAEAEEARRAAETKPGMDLSKVDCGTCHSCDHPTKENPCLQMCPRSVAEVIADAAHEILPSDVILLKGFKWKERRFMPVPFNHKLHADMAGMAGGCQICHHHTSPGKLHPSCSTCHEPAFKRDEPEQMRVPSLKGAYHRQCLGCHRDWSHTSRCSICHLPKGDQTEPITVEQVPSADDVAGHPPIESPHSLPYKTEYAEGPHVIFRHQEHVDRYGYTCERCHKGQTCARCHEQASEPGRTEAETRRQRHAACFPCHEDCACERCHTQQQQPEPRYFDHAAPGFVLGKYHEKLTCRACHRRLFFIRKLEGDCQFCHADWEPDSFDHAVTGQVLDENHAEIDCSDCHADRKFDVAPRCDECHDEDEGFVVPQKRPGPLAETKK